MVVASSEFGGKASDVKGSMAIRRGLSWNELRMEVSQILSNSNLKY